FDIEEGRHFRLDGGAGRVRADRTVAIVVTLATGQIAAEAPLGCDVMVVTAAGEVLSRSPVRAPGAGRRLADRADRRAVAAGGVRGRGIGGERGRARR